MGQYFRVDLTWAEDGIRCRCIDCIDVYNIYSFGSTVGWPILIWHPRFLVAPFWANEPKISNSFPLHPNWKWVAASSSHKEFLGTSIFLLLHISQSIFLIFCLFQNSQKTSPSHPHTFPNFRKMPRFKTFVATCATRWEPWNRTPAGRRGCRRDTGSGADNGCHLELCPLTCGFLVVSFFGVVVGGDVL